MMHTASLCDEPNDLGELFRLLVIIRGLILYTVICSYTYVLILHPQVDANFDSSGVKIGEHLYRS